MPGQASLRARQYYAHPQNLFWPVLGKLIGFDPAAPYSKRVQALKGSKIALWDVLESCHRPGSLDSAICRESAVANDLGAFLKKHKGITRIFFNGAAAEKLFHQKGFLLPKDRKIVFRRLPSTSPANAGIRYAQKARAWRSVGR